MYSRDALGMIIVMTLLPLLFMVPLIIIRFLERQRQRTFHFLVEFEPTYHALLQEQQQQQQDSASVTSEQYPIVKAKEVNFNLNKHREEIRSVLAGRNHPSPRDLLSQLCSSSTQRSSSGGIPTTRILSDFGIMTLTETGESSSELKHRLLSLDESDDVEITQPAASESTERQQLELKKPDNSEATKSKDSSSHPSPPAPESKPNG